MRAAGINRMKRRHENFVVCDGNAIGRRKIDAIPRNQLHDSLIPWRQEQRPRSQCRRNGVSLH